MVFSPAEPGTTEIADDISQTRRQTANSSQNGKILVPCDFMLPPHIT